MAILTWLDDNGDITTTYGCRRTYAQFPTKQALYHYIGREINGKDGKHRKGTKKSRNANAIVSVQKQIDDLKAEVELWKRRARKSERDLQKFRNLLKS